MPIFLPLFLSHSIRVCCYNCKIFMSRASQPGRFDRFIELKDGSGFTIPNCSFVFKYDRDGGWYDEYGNYFDRDGRPEDPPSSEDNRSDGDRDRSFSDRDSVGDEFQREFGGPSRGYEEEDDYQQAAQIKQLSKIAANNDTLGSYSCNEPLRVHFTNLHYFSKREEIFHHFSAKVNGILNLVFFNNERRQFNGKGYFVVADVEAAEGLVKFQGEKFGDREISFYVEEVEEFLLSPLESHETKCDLAPKGNKSYVRKTQPIIEKKIETAKELPNNLPINPPSVPAEVKPLSPRQQPKSEPIKQEESPQCFATYNFLKKAFPKKTSFKDWLSINKFDASDYQTVEKIVGREDYAKITMKRKVFLALNGKTYNGEKVEFVPE